MSSYIQRSENSGSTWTLIAVVDDSVKSYTDTTINVAADTIYRIISGSGGTTHSISETKHAPWQYFTASIKTIIDKYINATLLNAPGITIQPSASYTASYSGSMSGWVTGIPSQSLDQYFIRVSTITDVPYVVMTSSLYTATLNTSRSYASSYTGSFVGKITSDLPANWGDYYVAGFVETDTQYARSTCSVCVADIIFKQEYTLPYSGIISGSVKNLASGSLTDYEMYVYRYAPGDALYVTEGVPSCSISASGQWAQASAFAGHANFPIFAKMRRKKDKAEVAVAGFYPPGEYFNAGVKGYYITQYGATQPADGCPFDLNDVNVGTKIGKLVKQSSKKTLGVSNNPIPYTGSWVVTDFSTNPRVFRLASGSTAISMGNYDTASYIAETSNLTGLVNSYWSPEGELLTRRCFMYDQGVALVAITNQGSYSQAHTMAEGAMLALTGSKSGSFALSGSQWAFSVNASNGYYIDPYYRTGAQMWVAEGLSFFLEKYPTSSLYGQITASLKSFWQSMFQYYWCEASGSGLWRITSSAADYVTRDGIDTGYVENTQSYSGSGLQYHTFLGGAGVYHLPDYIFTASYVIPWSSCEHNTDAWFALRSSARAMGGAWSSSLEASASALGIALANNFWYASGSKLRQKNTNSQSRAYQGITNPYKPDDAHALDVATWYGLFLRAYGEMGKFSASMAMVPRYFLSDPNGSGAVGYTPYLAAYEYDGCTPTLWVEGTAGAILAWRAATSHSIAKEIYKSLRAIFTGSYGFPYATVADPVYEIGSSGSSTANTWLMIAENPSGFWEVKF